MTEVVQGMLFALRYQSQHHLSGWNVSMCRKRRKSLFGIYFLEVVVVDLLSL